ncbi:bifunctional adenosylcobinamide kinase/adenosylcobinamide-phosphate guanylyltransferase [Pulveribacter suum]|uniref:Bifunctional adenosylcobalamin biosynthesis protein n=1 Tax=Pulveribacter suum TaxID=2116657 RepID=A0A2P1NL03_9BURK|nr:bifunctional adenosylcobinamide kinase/adenosylcobinamide-phosphate guanylyltransferase [Pulveribacter suum]AVP57734.1 adenosylcobinamide-phosphate guanylyltransferase [Pulveribacter suum]
MNAEMNMQVARSELILGGQKSGKSRRAELLARAWLAQSPGHRGVFIATATAHDAEMHARIARHQHERAERVPGLQLLEEPRDLARALERHGRADTLLVVDCLTLWLTHWLMPAPVPAPAQGLEPKQPQTHDWQAQAAHFFEALTQCPGPVVMVGNEIGLGVIPLGREVRAFVDALGTLNQRAAAACSRVTLMAAGLPLTLKDEEATP